MNTKSARYNHLIGTEQGYLKVLDIVYGEMKNRHAGVKVLCSACGQERVISAQSFERGKSKSCGCQKYINRPSGLACKKTKSLIGEKFGKLTVVDCAGMKAKRVRWNCKCDCGNTKTVVGVYLTQGETASCGCDRYKTGAKNPLWEGYEEITGKMWSGIKNGAKVRNFEITVSIEEIWQKFLAQNRKCAITGLDLDMGLNASLDRINSAKGYTLENTQWVHRDVNVMKWDFDQNYFIQMCNLISKYNEKLT